MAVYDRVVEAFRLMKPAYSYKCRYPYHPNDHYVDEVVVEDGTAVYFLHAVPIAAFDGDYLAVYHNGYHTQITGYRLNAILYEFSLPIRVRNRYHWSTPVCSYIEYRSETRLFSEPLVIDVHNRELLNAEDLPRFIPARPTYIYRALKELGIKCSKQGDKLVCTDNTTYIFDEDKNGYIEEDWEKKKKTLPVIRRLAEIDKLINKVIHHLY